MWRMKMMKTHFSKSDITEQELFEGCDYYSNLSLESIDAAKKLYNYIVESAEVAEIEGKSLDDTLDEGILSGLLGGAAGAAFGPALGKALCKVLGINPSGTLGNLLTSRLVLGALGYELGY